jgi:hypothetical protein
MQARRQAVFNTLPICILISMGAMSGCLVKSVCYNSADCGASFSVEEPTGHFTDCTNDYGVLDMNGNVWEHVLNGDETRIRGGAFNCADSKTLHRCDHIPGNWTP